MTDDLVKIIRWYTAHNERIMPEHAKAAANRIEQLEVALRNITEGDIPRIVKMPFREDGQSSKHDRCKHGQWFYEDCGCCIEDYARKALEGKE